jgi:hypothetical protein
MSLKTAGVRIWYDQQYGHSHIGTLTWVEPWVIEAQKMYRSKPAWAGLTEVQFIVAMSPKGK